jgi:hypothetical protein
MNCSQSQANRRVDFSQTTVYPDGALLEFLHKHGSASLRTIQRHFSGTPAIFIAARVDIMLDRCAITIRRNGLSRRAGYVYQVREGSDLR